MAKKQAEIKLGSRVRDTITGLEGVAVARCVYLFGCVRISIQPSTLHDGKPLDWVSIDEPQLEVLSESKDVAPAPRHGPRPDVSRTPSPRR